MPNRMRSLYALLVIAPALAQVQPPAPFMGRNADALLAQAEPVAAAEATPAVPVEPAAPAEVPVAITVPDAAENPAAGTVVTTPRPVVSGGQAAVPFLGSSGGQAGVGQAEELPAVPGFFGGSSNTNPDVRVAEAELEQSRAQYNKTCQDVARDVALAHEQYKNAEKGNLRAAAGVKEGLLPLAEQGNQESVKASLEAELRNLLGMSVPVKKGDTLEFEPLPGRLEDMIDVALKRNADIKLAEAKIRVAELNVESVQQRASSRKAMRSGGLSVGSARGSYGSAGGSFGGGSFGGGGVIGIGNSPVDAEDHPAVSNTVDPESIPVRKPDANVANSKVPREAGNYTIEAEPKRPEIPEAIREKLNLEYGGEFVSGGDKTLQQLLEMISEHVGGFDFVVDINVDQYEEITLKLANPTINDILLALADQMYGTCFVVRDYGILVTSQVRAAEMVAPTIPSDVPRRTIRR